MQTKSIARIIPTIQAAALLGENIKVAKKKDKSIEDMVGLGAKNIIGISIIKVESDIIESL